jgi:chromosome segregation ATPase
MGLLTSGAVYGVFRVLSKQASASIGKERDIIRDEIAKYDEAIERATNVLQEMVSLDEQSRIEAEREKILKDIEQEKAKVKKLEGELEALQVRVDKQETMHNELKRGKEDSDKLAKQLRENKERVQSEATELTTIAAKTIASLKASIAAGGYNATQVNELTNIENALTTTATALKEFSDVYTRGATRFVNLEKQYEELEREFRKLVDKALSGEEVEGEEDEDE